MYEPEALDKIMRMCHEQGALIIADEVLTGFGRTGRLFATDYLLEQPDMVCLSKGLTGGTMALGVTTCKDNIYQAFLSEERLKMLFHGHSYTANPVACSAGLASMDLLLAQSRQESIRRINNRHLAFVQKIKEHSHVLNARVLGTIMAFECATGEGQTYFSSLRDWLYNFFITEKIVLRPLGNTVYFLPPYCITDEQLQQVYSAIEKMLKQLADQ
jgi:adenosylmethionine-8-amino-7-oxononanoate aminotransferase